MTSLNPLESYLITALLFPFVVSAGATWFIAKSRADTLRRMTTEATVESDVHNERLDPVASKNAEYLLFALLFNITYLTVNPVQVNQLLFHSPVFYAAALVAFLAGLFLILTFELRFLPRRFSILGVAFAALGTIVVTATVRFGFAQGTATGTATGSATGSATGAMLGGGVTMVLVPVVLVSCSWVLAAVALLLDRGADRYTLPFRIPWDRAYRVLIFGIVLGWVGIMLSLIPTLVLLVVKS